MAASGNGRSILVITVVFRLKLEARFWNVVR